MASVPKSETLVLSSGRGGRLKAWVVRHLQTFFFTLGLLARAPLASLLTAAVIGVALALPAGLYLVLENVQVATRGWESGNQVSLFLNLEVDDAAGGALADALRAWPEVDEVQIIDRGAALEEFRVLSGFAEVMDAFASDNPLPVVLVVTPRAKQGNADALANLVARLEAQPAVDFAQFDLAWLERLFAILDIIERGVLVLGALLAGGVLLVIGNTMRLAIENRRREIEVSKLFGATDAFIRRPFLYSGLVYGAIGGVIAWLLVGIGFLVLGGPVQQLTALYPGDYRLQGLGPAASLALVAGGGVLGLLGSWLSVGRHLAAIEPT